MPPLLVANAICTCTLLHQILFVWGTSKGRLNKLRANFAGNTHTCEFAALQKQGWWGGSWMQDIIEFKQATFLSTRTAARNKLRHYRLSPSTSVSPSTAVQSSISPSTSSSEATAFTAAGVTVSSVSPSTSASSSSTAVQSSISPSTSSSATHSSTTSLVPTTPVRTPNSEAAVFALVVRIERVFTADLANRNSQEFKSLSNEFIVFFYSVLPTPSRIYQSRRYFIFFG